MFLSGVLLSSILLIINLVVFVIVLVGIQVYVIVIIAICGVGLLCVVMPMLSFLGYHLYLILTGNPNLIYLGKTTR